MLQKNLAFHLSGHVLHSMFWETSPRRWRCARGRSRGRGERRFRQPGPFPQSTDPGRVSTCRAPGWVPSPGSRSGSG
jgi:hypothetical protein